MARRKKRKRKITAHNRKFGAAAKRCQTKLRTNFSFKKLGACMKREM